jgi:hypothetical protein
MFDPWVVLKKEFLTEQFNLSSKNQAIDCKPVYNIGYGPTSTTLNIPNPARNIIRPTIAKRTLTGEAWYSQTAVRAVNQVCHLMKVALFNKLIF